MKSNSDRRVWVFAYAPVLLWIGLILFLGSGSGSSAQTSRIIGPLIEFFFPNAEPGFVQSVHGFIRKSAHVTEYGILAALTARAALSFSSGWIRRYWPIPALLLVAAIATLDEFNQSFNVARTSSPWDVLLDISGGTLAIVVIWILRRRRASGSPDELTAR
jgi:VanZ family protein